MIFKRFYDDNLAQASYLIACENSREALVVDPTLDVAQYLRAAGAERLKVTQVTETHVHADFVSGARALSTASGATLHLSSEGSSEWSYTKDALRSARALADGDEIAVGSVRLRSAHTPGHTPEHLSFFVTDLSRGPEPVGALTGDFIFVGDVGRPDLLERAAGAEGSMESSAADLYKSIQRFLRQPDHLQIWPGHGAGSACGRALGSMPQSTLGYERLFNWALGKMSEREFVSRVLEDQPFPPAYFARMKKMNRSASAVAPDARALAESGVGDLADALRAGATVVDARPASQFAKSHIPGTLNIPAGKSFLNWCGALIPKDNDVYLIADTESPQVIESLVSDLAKIGINNVRGYFGHRIFHDSRRTLAKLEEIPQVDPITLRQSRAAGEVTVIDVRGPDEWRRGHLPGAIHIPLAALPARIADVDTTAPIVLHCMGGSRSAIAASLLKARGIENVANLTGGFEAWAKEGYDVETESPLTRSPASET